MEKIKSGGEFVPGNDIGPRIGIDGEAEFRKSIAAVNAQLKALGSEMKAVTAEFASNAQSEEALTAKNDVLSRSVKTAKDALGILDGQLDRQKQKLAALGAELDKVIAAEGANSSAAAKAQNAYNQQYAVVGKLESQYQTAKAQLAGFTNALDEASDASAQAGTSLAGDVLAGTAAWEMIQTAVRGTTEALREAVVTGMEFDASMADVAATMGTSVDALGELRGFALEMGQTTVFTATQAAQALNYMALAGYDAQTSMETLPNVLNLAAAGGIELAQASDMVTDAQSALGLSMEQTALLVDEMAKTSTKTNTSVGQLGEAILTVGGTAKFMAGGTAELNQVLGVLADNSIKGAEGGTKLRNIILSLTSPTEKAAATLEKLGVSAFDAEGQMRAFSDIFPELQRSLSTLTSQEQIAALSEIFNSRDIAAAQALLGTTAERWDELSAAIDGAQGSAQRMAETRLDNLAGDLTLMQSAADGAKIALTDSLTPALRGAAQAGTGLFSFVGDALEKFPALGSVFSGVTTSLAALTVGVGAYTAATTFGTAATAALSAAFTATPIGAIALGIGGVTAALTAFARAADDGKTAYEEFSESLEASKQKLDENEAAASASSDELRAQADALLFLAESGELNAAQQQALLSMIEELNGAIPGLNLAYDEQTGKLNMTADAVRDLIEAEAQRLLVSEGAQAYSEILVQQTETARQLKDAEAELESVRAEAAAAMEREAQTGEVDIGVKERLEQKERELIQLIEELKEVYGEQETALSGIADKYGDVASNVEKTGASMEDAAEGAEDTTESCDELAEAAAGAEEAVLFLAGAADNLTDALKEQENSGSLSLKTTQELMEAGYGAAIAIDQETGAVTLNKDEYIRLAGAKLQEQIATLEASKAELESKKALDQVTASADRAGGAYWDMAKAKAAAAYADDAKALDVQIAALNRAMGALNSYGSSAASAARSSGRASRQIKTQAQKDLEEYKNLKSELDHEKTMELISEADYYRRLTQLRDQYLTDAANIDEYRKVSETIYKADQKALQEREKLWQTAGDSILKLEEDFQKELSSRAAEIVNSYKLFDEVPEYQRKSGAELIANLEDQISAIETFYGNVAALEERGVSANLVDEIRKMGVSASGELAGLLELTDEQLTRYSDLFGEKQELANRLAADELKGLRNETDQAILEQLNSVGELYDTNGPALGLAFANSLAEGMFEGIPAVEAMAKTVASAAMSAFEHTYNRDVEAMMAQPKPRVTSGDIGELLAGAVNGINAGGGGYGSGDLKISIDVDGRTLAETTLEDFRTVGRERPETLDDK